MRTTWETGMPSFFAAFRSRLIVLKSNRQGTGKSFLTSFAFEVFAMKENVDSLSTEFKETSKYLKKTLALLYTFVYALER